MKKTANQHLLRSHTREKRPATLSHGFELIDFSCSLRSSQNQPISSRLCSLLQRCNQRLLVIRPTTLSANNFSDFHFCHRVNHPGRKQFHCRCQEMKGKTFASYFRLLFAVHRREGKCVHSPSIHHAISRQKLSINHSGTSIK